MAESKLIEKLEGALVKSEITSPIDAPNSSDAPPDPGQAPAPTSSPAATPLVSGQNPTPLVLETPERSSSSPSGPSSNGSSAEQPGYEIFIGNLQRSLAEHDLYKLVSAYGTVQSIQLAKDARTKSAKGYAFVKLATKFSCDRLIHQLDGVEFQSRKLGVINAKEAKSLFIGNLHKIWGEKDFQAILDPVFGPEVKANLMMDPNEAGRNRGFAFLDFPSHEDAVRAQQMLQASQNMLGGIRVSVDWAQPVARPDETTMGQVRSVFISRLPPSYPEDMIRTLFSPFGTIDRVALSATMRTVSRRDFAIVYYMERASALKAISAMDGVTVAGKTIRVALARPPKDSTVSRPGPSADSSRPADRGSGSSGGAGSRYSSSREERPRSGDRGSGSGSGGRYRDRSPPSGDRRDRSGGRHGGGGSGGGSGSRSYRHRSRSRSRSRSHSRERDRGRGDWDRGDHEWERDTHRRRRRRDRSPDRYSRRREEQQQQPPPARSAPASAALAPSSAGPSLARDGPAMFQGSTRDLITQLCEEFESAGSCSRGDTCPKLHGLEEILLNRMESSRLMEYIRLGRRITAARALGLGDGGATASPNSSSAAPSGSSSGGGGRRGKPSSNGGYGAVRSSRHGTGSAAAAFAAGGDFSRSEGAGPQQLMYRQQQQNLLYQQQLMQQQQSAMAQQQQAMLAGYGSGYGGSGSGSGASHANPSNYTN